MSDHANDEQLLAALIDVVKSDYRHYSETPGYLASDYANAALRRWRSSSRRGISTDDPRARVMDLAKGLEQLLHHRNRNHFTDLYLPLAEQMVEVLLKYESPKAPRPRARET